MVSTKEMDAQKCFHYYTDLIREVAQIRGYDDKNIRLTEAIEEYYQRRLECMQAVNDGKKYPPVIK